MWQHYLKSEIPLQSLLALLMVHSQRADMSDEFCQTVGLHSSQSQHRPNDSIFIARWDIAAGYDDVRIEETRIGSKLSYLGLLILEERVCQPARSNDSYALLYSSHVLRKVTSHGYNVCDMVKIGDTVRIKLSKLSSASRNGLLDLYAIVRTRKLLSG